MTSNITRRRFLVATSAWAAGSSTLRSQNDDERTRTISIIHTTDLHGHILPTRSYGGRENVGGLARCATRIRQWRAENPHSLLVDVGDLYQGTAASYLSQGGLFVKLLGQLDYDAWVLGNHDFDWGPESLIKNLAASKTSILTANLQLNDKTPGNLPADYSKIIPWKMCETGGFKIALIGLVTPGLESWLTPETLGGISPTDPSPALKKSIAEAKSAKADAIVVVGHFGTRVHGDDYANPLVQTLRDAPGAEVFLGAHTHTHHESIEVEGVLYSQASYHGLHLGKIDLTFDLQTRKLIAKAAITDFMDERYELDPAILQTADPDLRKSEAQLSRKICTVKNDISGKGNDSPLFHLLCQTFIEALGRADIKVDAVFHGTFGTEVIPAGELTVRDAWSIIPYENFLVTATLTAAQLLEVISQETGRFNRNLWPLRVIRDGRKAIAIHQADGSEIPPDTTLTIAFNSYDSQSGARSLNRLKEIIFTPEANRQHLDINTRDALIEGLLNRQEI